ncbi:MAG: hypothetical protein IKC37_02990, partial [Clostridia bacterium]|nr:hypothetical protein [Clostridia bacterium]
MIGEAILNALSHILMFIGFVYLAGYIISLLNRSFYRLTGAGMGVVYATGIIGTPIHELSHAAMCVVFRHKIVEMRLFRIADDGVLGYVSHSYNPKNIWQRIGNYFIGVAPIVISSIFLYLMMQLFLPNTFAAMRDYMAVLGETSSGLASFKYMWEVLGLIISSMLSEFGSGFFFLLLSMCIALHMNLSGADIQGSLSALPILIGVIFVVNLILALIGGGAYSGFLGFMNSGGTFIMVMLVFAIVLSLFCIVIALI